MMQVAVMFIVLFISVHENFLKGTVWKNFSNYNGVICIMGVTLKNDARTEVYRSVTAFDLKI